MIICLCCYKSALFIKITNLCITTYSTTYGYELWKYDGTNAPSMVADTRSGSSNGYSKHLTVFNNELYFVALDSFDGTTLWKTDGTTTGTSMVADINPGAFGANMNYLTAFNNELFFSADDGTHGEELWKYDGINAPIMVADLVPGSAGGLPGHFTISIMNSISEPKTEFTD